MYLLPFVLLLFVGCGPSAEDIAKEQAAERERIEAVEQRQRDLAAAEEAANLRKLQAEGRRKIAWIKQDTRRQSMKAYEEAKAEYEALERVITRRQQQLRVDDERLGLMAEDDVIEISRINQKMVNGKEILPAESEYVYTTYKQTVGKHNSADAATLESAAKLGAERRASYEDPMQIVREDSEGKPGQTWGEVVYEINSSQSEMKKLMATSKSLGELLKAREASMIRAIKEKHKLD